LFGIQPYPVLIDAVARLGYLIPMLQVVAETRSVDEQVGWLNNSTIIDGVLQDKAIAALNPLSAATPGIASGTPLATDTWSVPADGSGSPHLFNTGTWSEVVTDR
jgi:hypothetical protein